MAQDEQRGPRSAILDGFSWLEYAFQPAGQPVPVDAAYGQQRHSATVVLASQNLPPKSCESDGVIGENHLPVAVYTADCLPVLFADPCHQQVAAVHAGLKGTLRGVLNNAVDRLLERGASSETLHVAIGPAIGACCYELDRDLVTQMQDRDDLPPLAWSSQQPRNMQAIRPQAHAQQQGIWFDLPHLARSLLLQRGILAEHIEVLNVCTYCMAEPGSSYRYNTHFNSGYQSRFSWIRTR
jgi:YfiH family protein